VLCLLMLNMYLHCLSSSSHSTLRRRTRHETRGMPNIPGITKPSSAVLYAEVLQRCQAHPVSVEHVIHPHTRCAAGLSRQNNRAQEGDFPQDNMHACRTNREGSLAKSATQRPTLSMDTEAPSPAWTLSTSLSNSCTVLEAENSAPAVTIQLSTHRCLSGGGKTNLKYTCFGEMRGYHRPVRLRSGGMPGNFRWI
jgi:hypothetical protein